MAGKLVDWAEALVVVISIFFLDYLFHDFFTTPMEYTYHFGMAAVLAYPIAHSMYYSKKTTPATASIIFGSIFAALHRFGESFGLEQFSTFPDIMIGAQTFTTTTHPLTSAIIMGVVHGLIFYFAIQIAKQVDL